MNNNKQINIAIMSVADIDNYGDTLFPFISQQEILKRIPNANFRFFTPIDCAKRMIEAFGDEYTVIITADHGGHDRSHGTDSPEDMTIPMIFRGKRFTPARELDGVSILDIAPTVADIIGVPPAREWEGRSLANKE